MHQTENIILQLGNYTPNPETIPDSDATNPRIRQGYGWKPGMSEEEAWLSTQGWWPLSVSRAIDAHYAIGVNLDRIIVAVARVDGLIKGDGRHWILGKVNPDDPHRAWVGKRIRKNHSRNPVSYIPESAFIQPGDLTDRDTCVNPTYEP